MAIRLIITADDFGASEPINSAVALARQGELLTTASLMIGGQAARGAIELAHRDPTLAVGLHIVLSERNPVRTALTYYFDKSAREQVGSKLVEQFEAFASTGLPLSHVDGHWHLHAHPAVLPHVVKLAIRYGAHGVR
ncbi:MAG: ChbG/HpnK family deacetylase, partial [Armatimonadetes bacterium]|nr:ChbG/HpnK family deacetylase [Armatimonadota bacterium]